MLQAYNFNRNPRNLSTLTVPEYPVINGEYPERYRTKPQPTALSDGDRVIDAQEAMKLGFDLEKQITFRNPKGMNPFGGFKSTGRIGKLDRFIFDFGHNSIKDQAENQQRREPFNMPSGVNPSFEIDLAPAQPYTPVHRLRRRQDTQTLVTPLYSDVANMSTTHLSQLVSNKRMLENRDGVAVNATKNDPLASNKTYGDESRAASVKRVVHKDVRNQEIDAGYHSAGAHGITEVKRETADIRGLKYNPREHEGQHINARKNVEGNFKTEVKINPELLLPRREFMQMQARQQTDYTTQMHEAAGSFNPDERVHYIQDSDIRRQAGYETDLRVDATTRQRELEIGNHMSRDGMLVDSKLTQDASGRFQLRTDDGSVADPHALRQYQYYNLNAYKDPEYKPELLPDVPDNFGRTIKTTAVDEIHSGASNPGTARDMMPQFRMGNFKGRQSVQI